VQQNGTEHYYSGAQSPDNLLDQLTDLVVTVHYLVVDGPAGLSESTRAILMRADARRGADTTEWHRRTISPRCRETYQTSSIGQTMPTPSVDIPQRCGEGNETQNRSNGIVRETCTHHQAVLKSVIHQKQVIADSSGQAATVWDLGEAVNQPHILGKSTAECLRKSREP